MGLSIGDKGLDLKLGVPRETLLVSNANSIIACHFPCFAANEIKGREVAIGNGASCLA